MPSVFVSCPKGLESLLYDELLHLGVSQATETRAGVEVTAEWPEIYRACIWSRLASRVLYPLAEFACADDQALYQQVRALDWQQHMQATGSLWVDVVLQQSYLQHSRYVAQRVKDAVVDYWQDREGVRPNVERTYPDLRLNLLIKNNQAILSLDFGGGSLHQRGYRQGGGPAPLKENLAAALLIRAGWPQRAAAGEMLFDPMCGSGTLIIEGALMALDCAPGLLRPFWGVSRWRQFQPKLWETEWRAAEERRQAGRQRELPLLLGHDYKRSAIHNANLNARQAGLGQLVSFEQHDLVHQPHFPKTGPGLLISNPPYGERLGDMPELVTLYTRLGQCLRELQQWSAAIFSSQNDLLKLLKLRADKRYKLFNGALPCILACYSIQAKPVEAEVQTETSAPKPLSEQGQMLANRLRKNQRKLKSWLKQSGLECYRLYDADLPEFNVAVDRYADQVVIQEYAPPATIPAEVAQQRLLDAVWVVTEVLALEPTQITLKQRRQQRGEQQYQRIQQKNQQMVVQEYGAKFWVNVKDFLDTGLFLDHRLLRHWLQQHSAQQRVLNLFAYTATASVHAALGGAATTTSVDMSNTYMAWAQRNFSLNKLDDPKRHRFIQADCLAWLAQAQETFDVIFIDPPTFSNSKRMQQSFDIQRDHVHLLRLTLRCLAAEGVILFSTNARKFKLDHAALAELGLEIAETTAQTTSPDFARRPLHLSWRLRRVS